MHDEISLCSCVLLPRVLAISLRSRPKTEVHYGNGPVWQDAGLAELPNWTVLARYETEIGREGAPQTSAGRTGPDDGQPPGAMIGTASLIASRYGEGRVMASSPHPEFEQRFEGMLLREMLWAAGRLDGALDPQRQH